VELGVHRLVEGRLAFLLHGCAADGAVVDEVAAGFEDLAQLEEGVGVGGELVALLGGDWMN
jgi:hypothetical protein